MSVWWMVLGCATTRDVADWPDQPGRDPGSTTPGDRAPPPADFLILLADDVGIDKIAAYGVADHPPVTPSIDSLFASGVRFHNAWSLPSCSPTRSALMTGRFGRRYGIGVWFDLDDGKWSLPDSERTLPEILAEAPHRYTSALAGKWHLVSRFAQDPARDPERQGFAHHSGSIANLDASLTEVVVRPRGYYNWEKYVDGVPGRSTTYATTDTADEAIRFVQTLPEPWFVLVAFNAAHSPWSAPPSELTPNRSDEPQTDREKEEAAIEAMDTEIGRILAALTPTQVAGTTIAFLGDNGTPEEVVAPSMGDQQHKGTVAEGGVRVPFVVTGPQVPVHGAVSEALVSVVDLLPTFAEIAGLDPDALTAEDGTTLELDGHSLVSALADPADPGPNRTLYADAFSPNGAPPYRQDDRAVRGARFEFVLSGKDGPHLYDVTEDLADAPDLLAGQGPLSEEAETAYEEDEAALQLEQDRLQFEPQDGSGTAARAGP